MDIFSTFIFLAQSTPVPTDAPTLEEISNTVRLTVHDEGLRTILITLFLTGLSISIGRSYMLLANQVTPRRLIASMFFAVFTFAFSLMAWTAAVYWIGISFYDIDFTWTFWEISGLVIMAFTPLTQAWLGLLPYLGNCLVRFLYVQSVALLYLSLVIVGFGWRQSMVAILVGALILLISQMTILRPLIALQNRIAGTHLRNRYSSVIKNSRLELQ